MTSKGHHQAAQRPEQPPEQRVQLGGLLTWHPLRWLGWLALGVVAVPATRLMLDAGHFVPGGLAIETDGASGRIGDGRFSLALPMRVYNGTNRVITKVSLWVDAYACPGEGAALPACTKFTSFEQSVAMKTAPKSSGWFAQSVSGGLPDHLAGDALRIERRVQGVEDAAVNGDDDPVPGESLGNRVGQSVGPPA